LTGDDLKDVVRELTRRTTDLLEVVSEVSGRFYLFYHGKASEKNLFATFWLTENVLRVRVRTDPAVPFEDPNGWTRTNGFKTYLLWLLGRKQEKEFVVTKKEHVDYAMELLTQAYLQTRPLPHEQLKTGIYGPSGKH